MRWSMSRRRASAVRRYVSAMRDATDGAKERLMVALRVRPLRPAEASRVLHVVDDKTVVLEDPQRRGGSERGYSCDMVLGEQSSQQQVYTATVAPLVKDVLRGFHAAVFAYGATGSGKTHTMVGRPQNPGVMVRALDDLFQGVGGDPAYSVSLSYLEIYNENIRDLLTSSPNYLELREDQNGGVQVAGLSQISASSTEEVMSLLQQGNRARTVESTAVNQTSSRSHALLSVTVTHTTDNGHQGRSTQRRGRLFMVDLAGSERASNTQNRGRRLAEGAHINRSLLALGNVISALAAGRGRYVNFRDSKLTRLLKDALSGSCRTVMLAHVSPAQAQREETRQTLLYAERARRISNKVERNELEVSYHVSQYRAVINELREEVARLRSKLEKKEETMVDDKIDMPESPAVTQLREDIIATFQQQMALRRQLMEVEGRLLALGAEAERQQMIIAQWDNKLYQQPSRKTAVHRRQDSDPMADWSDTDSTDGNILQQAWAELAYIEREQERYIELRAETQRQLERVRNHGKELENELPGSGEERELLALLCRVHELEADKMSLQGERLVRQYELQRRELLIQRYDRQRQLSEHIITRQRQLMEESSVRMPTDLRDLYQLYQREIHAAAYSVSTPLIPQTARFSNNVSSHSEKLPPINLQPEPLFQRSARFSRKPGNSNGNLESEMSLQSPSSSASSEVSTSPFPSISKMREEQDDIVSSGVLFPPIDSPHIQSHRSNQRNRSGHRVSNTTSHLPRPFPRNRDKINIRKTSSHENLSSAKKVQVEKIWPD